MLVNDYVSALRRDGARLAAAADGAFSLPVPSCPGWTMADLVWHTAEVHYFWRTLASGAVPGPDEYQEPERVADADLLAWFVAGVAETADVLAPLDPAAPVWTWAAQKDIGFIQRRMAQETAVHAWDAVAAARRDEPIERELALDGIDEYLTHMLPAAETGAPGEFRVSATDSGREWVVPGYGDGVLAGDASDLLLVLWRRHDAESLTKAGDPAALLAAAQLD